MNEMLLTFLAVALVVALALFIYIGLFARRPAGLNREYYEKQWILITRMLDGGQSDLHLAVLEADKLLDKALKERGFAGKTMGERLKAARKKLTNNNAVWGAHKLRNRLAHENDVKLSHGQVRSALSGFKLGLKDVGAL